MLKVFVDFFSPWLSLIRIADCRSKNRAEQMYEGVRWLSAQLEWRCAWTPVSTVLRPSPPHLCISPLVLQGHQSYLPRAVLWGDLVVT